MVARNIEISKVLEHIEGAKGEDSSECMTRVDLLIRNARKIPTIRRQIDKPNAHNPKINLKRLDSVNLDLAMGFMLAKNKETAYLKDILKRGVRRMSSV
jgi:hypothetical protein